MRLSPRSIAIRRQLRRTGITALPLHLAMVGLLAVLFSATLTSCGGLGIRSNVSVGPRLTAARLGSIQGAMTYDGDWLGGIPPQNKLSSDLELAARRGVDLVIDLRSARARANRPLDEAVEMAGLTLVTVSDGPIPGGPIPEGLAPGGAGESLQLSAYAVDEVRSILNAPGRRRSLLLDESGTSASMVYAIHLAVDEGIAEAEALRAARSTGMSQANADFVHEQIERIRARS